MIVLKEYRIGNYLLADEQLAWITQLSDGPTPQIKFTSVTGASVFEKCSSDRVQPLLLTDETLVQFSYRFHPHFKLWQHAKAPAAYTLELDTDYTALDFFHRPMVKNLTYVHRLQNLYYEILGEELIMSQADLLRHVSTVSFTTQTTGRTQNGYLLKG